MPLLWVGVEVNEQELKKLIESLNSVEKFASNVAKDNRLHITIRVEAAAMLDTLRELKRDLDEYTTA